MDTIVGHILITTESDNIIEEDVATDISRDFLNSQHPHQKISMRVQEIIEEQEKIGDPIAAISAQKYSDDDLIGDEPHTGIF